MGEKKSASKLISKSKNGKKTVKGTAIKLSSGKENGKKPEKKIEVAGIKKQYLKSNGACKVTFTLPRYAAPNAQVVTIVGDFNNWNLTETPMKRLNNGDFTVTLKLSGEREYRFRYFIDANRWENDWKADRYVPNAYGCDDSLVVV